MIIYEKCIMISNNLIMTIVYIKYTQKDSRQVCRTLKSDSAIQNEENISYKHMSKNPLFSVLFCLFQKQETN